MSSKSLRQRIAMVIVSLFVLGSTASATGQASSNHSYLPLIEKDWSGWIGPFGGYIVSVVIDPQHPQTLYAGTFGSGVFKSLDGGQTWQASNLGLDNLYINSLAIDPSHPSTLYAGTYKSRMYKSTDSGHSWFWSGKGMQDQAIVYAIAIDRLQPNRIYASTRGISNNGNPPWRGVVYKSEDGGASWNASLTNVGGADSQDWVYSLAINPTYSPSVYAATHEHGPYHSNNLGDSWYPIHDGISDDSGRAIVISPDTSDTTTVFYGVWHFDTLYKSINGGNEWFTSNYGIPWVKVSGISIDPLHVDTIYLATAYRGILKSIDGGDSWQQDGLQGQGIYQLTVHPNLTDRLYAGTIGNGLQRSLDGGTTWQAANQGIENAMATSSVCAPSGSGILYSSIFGAGVLRSQDSGKTWTQLNAGLADKNVHALVSSQANPNLIYALTDTAGLFVYNLSDGSGWTSVDQGLPLTFSPPPAFSPDHPFADREMQEPFTNPSSGPVTDQAVFASLLAMTYAPSDPQIAYLGTGGSGVYKSNTAGSSWLPTGLISSTVTSIAVDFTNPNLVYAATTLPGTLKVSSNGGSTWRDAPLPVTFYTLATSPADGGLLFAGTSNGLYTYRSGTWKILGLDSQAVTALAIDRQHASRMFAGTTSGAYFSTNGGASWKLVDPALNGITIQSITLDPARPSLIYFNTKTHGIYLADIHN